MIANYYSQSIIVINYSQLVIVINYSEWIIVNLNTDLNYKQIDGESFSLRMPFWQWLSRYGPADYRNQPK
jgi:hypothetical protein